MRKLLAGLLVVIFIPLFSIVFLAFNLQSIFLDKEEVKDSLKKTGFYEQIAPAVAKDIYSTEVEIDIVTKEELSNILVNILTPDNISSDFENTIDQLFPYILSETDSFRIEYNTKKYKDNFVQEAESFLLKEVEALTKCTEKQLETFTLEDSDEIPVCKPPGFTSEEILNGVVNGDLDEILVNYPDEVTVTEKEVISKPISTEITLEESPEQLLEGLRNIMAQRRQALLIGFGALAFLLILIALLRWGSIKSVSKWLGWTLLLASINFVIISFLLYYSTTFIEGYLGNIFSSVTLTTVVVSDLLRKMFFAKALPQAIVIAILGLAMILIPLFTKPKGGDKVTT